MSTNEEIDVAAPDVEKVSNDIVNAPSEGDAITTEKLEAISEPQPPAGWGWKRKAIFAFLSLVVLLGLIALIVWLVNPPSTVLEDYLKILEERKITPESSDEEIRQAVVAMNEFYKKKSMCKAAGNVVGVSRGKSRIYETSKAGTDAMNENTLFEIGSISKPVTGLVLAHQISAGSVSLDTPLNDVLPETIPDLVVQDKLVTFRNLVTHTAGFPRLSKNVLDLVESGRVGIKSNPYAGFTEQDMLEQIEIAATNGLSQTGLVEYSNFGFSILAYLLGKNANDRSFQELQQGLTEQLDLTSTFVGTIREDAKQRLSTPNHPSKNEAVSYWYDGGLFSDGAGSTVSSASDLLSLAAMLMPYDPTESSNTTAGDDDEMRLKQALALSLTHLKLIETTVEGDSGIAFGWFWNEGSPDQTVYQHNGGTAGFSTVLTFQPKSQTAIVALANCGETFDIAYMGAALGQHLFEN